MPIKERSLAPRSTWRCVTMAAMPTFLIWNSPIRQTPSTFNFGKLTTLLAWHRLFAVLTPERQRNTNIYQTYQHNRNPFIDHPDYAEMVFYGVSPGEAWEDTNFTDAEMANPSIGGDAADPDGDGVRNLFEYVYDRDPWQDETVPTMSTTVTSQAGSYSFLLSFSHNRNATDVLLSYEGTSDFVTWTNLTSQLVSDIVTSSETEQITVAFPVPTPLYFRQGSSYQELTRITWRCAFSLRFEP